MPAEVLEVRYLWLDATGSRSALRRFLPGNTSASAARSRAAALALVLSAASRARLMEYTIVWTDEIDGQPAATAPLNPHGVLFFGTDDPAEFYDLPIPGILPALVLPPADELGGLRLDLAAPAIAGLVNELITGGWLNPFSVDITQLIAGYIQNRTYGQIYVSS